MKKAFLVTFCPTTRVVVDVKDEKLYDEADYNAVIIEAIEKMVDLPYHYLQFDNVEVVKLDEELPYPQEFDI